MLKYPVLASLFLSVLCAAAACTGERPPEAGGHESTQASSQGSDTAIPRVRAAVRAMSQPDPTVDSVAAEMEGVIKARTGSQALIHYDGYRATFTTPGDRVTQVRFQLIEAKPSLRQLNEEFGTPSEISKGMLYKYESGSTGARLVIVAEPVSKPADEDTLVNRILVQGAPTR